MAAMISPLPPRLAYAYRYRRTKLTPAPVDLPPPPPGADPREPEPSFRRTSRTPQRGAGARSPLSSRASSPCRPQRGDSTSPPPLVAPTARSASAGTTLSVHAPASPLKNSSSSHALGHGYPHALHHPHAGHPHLSRPGSPASIHSSGSAIFERDIELPLGSQTLSSKASRIFHPHGSQLEQSVPAVLDDAVEALTNAPGEINLNAFEIEAPSVSSHMLGSRSPSAQLSPQTRSRVMSMERPRASRSPSPERNNPLLNSPPILAALSTQLQNVGGGTSIAGSVPTLSNSSVASPDQPLSPISPIEPIESLSNSTSPTKHRPAPLRKMSSGPQLPGGWAFTDEDAEGATAVKEAPAPPATAPNSPPSHQAAAPGALLTPTTSNTAAGTATAKEKRRISFISYNDLLLGVPTSVASLGEIASGNLSPDHLPGLPGTLSPPPIVAGNPTRSPVIGASGAGASASVATSPSMPNRDSLSPQPQLEGEWSREGLGRGLEQRLEDLVLLDSNKA